MSRMVVKDVVKFRKCCDAFIDRRTERIKRDPYSSTRGPARAEALKEMSFCCNEIHLSIEDFIYLSSELKLSEMCK